MSYLTPISPSRRCAATSISHLPHTPSFHHRYLYLSSISQCLTSHLIANEVRIIGDELPTYCLQSAFDRHRMYLTNSSDRSSRGAGYWFWKPLVISDNIKRSSVKNGTFIVYSDPDRPDVVNYVGMLLCCCADVLSM
jgi:hypothetical protein